MAVSRHGKTRQGHLALKDLDLCDITPDNYSCAPTKTWRMNDTSSCPDQMFPNRSYHVCISTKCGHGILKSKHSGIMVWPRSPSKHVSENKDLKMYPEYANIDNYRMCISPKSSDLYVSENQPSVILAMRIADPRPKLFTNI